MLRRSCLSSLLFAALVACSGSSSRVAKKSPHEPAAPKSAPAPTPAAEGRPLDAAHVAKLAEIVTSYRGLSFKKPLPPVLLVPQSKLPESVGENFTYMGRYMADSHRILMSERLEKESRFDPILVHELVHALMVDYGVSTTAFGTTANGKADVVVAARIEGEADLIEYGYRGLLDGRLPRRTMAGLPSLQTAFIPIACRMEKDPETCSIVASPYTEGRAFASAMYRAGGPALLSAVHTKPPTTMLEILYPDLYLAGEKERSLTDLGDAVERVGKENNLSIQARSSVGVFLMGSVLTRNGMNSERARRLLRGMRGDEVVALERGGQLILTEWVDEAAARAFKQQLPSERMFSAVIGTRRILMGINVPKNVIEEVAKNTSPKATVVPPPTPPFGHPISLGAPPWEDDLATALRVEGSEGFKRVGIEASLLRQETKDAGHVWLSPAGEKLFVFPESCGKPDGRVMNDLFSKAWDDTAEESTLTSEEKQRLDVGEMTLWTSAFGKEPSRLHFGIARIPLCGDSTAALFVFQFGADASVKARLVKNVGTLRLSKAPGRICERLKIEAASDFDPPKTF